MAGLYVHFPFCASKCSYCDFYARVRRDWEPYVEALLAELSARKEELRGIPPSTLYFGGGTPSLLPPPLLQRVADGIRSAFGMSHPSCPPSTGHLFAEFTIEVNPDDITPEKAAALRATGASRISMGVQSFCDEHLRWMHRRHTAEDAERAFMLLREAGFENLSLDLIFGFTGLSRVQWKKNIDRALALQPEHISCYQMTGRHADSDEERCRSQYTMLQERLLEAGYLQYEISNYALPGRASRHNSACWAREPYLGLGAGAHSFDGGRLRRWNTPDIDAYLAGRPWSSEELSEREVLEEKLMLSLRTVQGLDLTTLSAAERESLNETTLEELSRAGRLIIASDRIRIPKEELFVSDAVIRMLFP